SYLGAGDVVSGATAWWGLRAYSAATIGTSAIRLRRDSDNAEQDFASVGGGNLDISSITSFQGGANVFVRQLYDQNGNANDWGPETAANQPGFSLTAIGGSKPGMTLALASSQRLANTTMPAAALTTSFSMISFVVLAASHGSFPNLFYIGPTTFGPS